MPRPTSPDVLTPPRARPLFAWATASLLLAGLVLAALAAGCGPSRVEVSRNRLEFPLAALADSGDVEALRMVADIEVLRADGMFSDSLANILMTKPATEFFAVDDKGVRTRSGRGTDITTLLAYTTAEPMLLKEAVITPEQSAELRRLAVDNMAAAAEMAAGFGTGSSRSP